MSKRQRRTYTEEFKQQLVNLYNAGKSQSEIIREYERTPSASDKWVKQANTTGLFKEKDNQTPEQKELALYLLDFRLVQSGNHWLFLWRTEVC